MAKKNRRTKNPMPVWGWVVGGLAVVGYGIYWWQDRQRNRATDERYAAQAAIDERTRLIEAGAVPTTMPPAPPAGTTPQGTSQAFLDLIRLFAEGKKGA